MKYFSLQIEVLLFIKFFFFNIEILAKFKMFPIGDANSVNIVQEMKLFHSHSPEIITITSQINSHSPFSLYICVYIHIFSHCHIAVLEYYFEIWHIKSLKSIKLKSRFQSMTRTNKRNLYYFLRFCLKEEKEKENHFGTTMHYNISYTGQ